MRLGGINKTCGLGAVDCLAEGAMQESILKVVLMHRPVLREPETEQCERLQA